MIHSTVKVVINGTFCSRVFFSVHLPQTDESTVNHRMALRLYGASQRQRLAEALCLRIFFTGTQLKSSDLLCSRIQIFFVILVLNK